MRIPFSLCIRALREEVKFSEHAGFQPQQSFSEERKGECGCLFAFHLENTVIGLEEALSCLLVLHLQFMQGTHPEPANESFDSSQELEVLSLTQTTHSLQEHTRAAHSELDFTASLDFTPSKDPQPLEHSLSVGFVGFRNGWGGKDIVINESKLKRARKFMADSQEQSVQKQKNDQQQEEEDEMMKMPCFKAMGSGAEVKVSQAAQEQATRLFRQFQSTRKPTKMKKAAKFITQSMIKTYSLQSKIKPIPHQPLRDSFNWEEYQKEFRREVEQLRPQSKSKKRSTLAKRKVSNPSPVKDFVFVRLPSLQVTLEREIQLGERLREESQHMLDRKYDHICGNCGGVQCVLCRVECPLTELTVLDVYGVLNERFSKQRVGYEQFLNHYSAVCFKLLRHQLYWPEIANKQCHPSNILVEIHKRTILMEKTDPSFLRECLSGAIGRSLNVVVRDKCINDKLAVVYLLLSDGWQSVWAAIGEGNLLFKYLKDNSKVRVGTKLALALWDLHPLSNILAFCPKAHNDDRCLEFFFNGSIILKANARLGRSKEEFYRPLSKCRTKGGLVPVIEGFVVRLFAGKQASKRGKAEQTTAVPHFAELLTPEGLTCLVRFLLPEDGSLVEYFRLYHCYRLYRVKIGEEQTLTFLMGQSQLRQVNEHKVSEKEGKYPPNMMRLLSTRLLNCRKQWDDGTFDLLCLAGKTKIGDKEWNIEVQGQTNSNFSAVYQQFLVSKTGPASLKLTKQRHSSQLRKCPKIYEQLTAQY